MRIRYVIAAVLAAVVSTAVVTSAVGQKGVKDGTLSAVLLGKKEVNPTTGKKRAGDLNGRGGATAVIDGNQFCYGIVVKNIGTPSGAHVHKGRSNQAGGIVIPLATPSGGNPGTSGGCVTVSDAALLAAIRKRPHRYYVNVHTTDFPAGAVRGQLGSKRN